MEEPKDKMVSPEFTGHLSGSHWHYTEVTTKEKRQYGLDTCHEEDWVTLVPSLKGSTIS